MKRKIAALGLVAFLSIAVAHSRGAVRYALTDLGTLGTLGGLYSYALGINNNGQVVGRSDVDFSSQHAFLWSQGTMTDLGSLGGNSAAFAINADGEAVGDSGTGWLTDTRPFSYNGSMADLGSLGGAHGWARAINASGQIAGFSENASTVEHAFTYQNGTMTDLGASLGGTFNRSCANAINDNGQVAGYYTSSGYEHGFLWTSGQITNLGFNTRAYAINNKGQVAGLDNGHAFLYSNGSMTNLGYISGGSGTIAYALNSDGKVVGSGYTSVSGVTHAFVYDGATIADLNDLIDPGLHWSLTEAYGINDSGEIVGYGTVNLATHAFLLTPVPEPATIVLLGIGAAGLVAYGWRRRPA